MSRKKMFSDSWHLVADKHASLLPNIETQKQYYHGECWYILRDQFNNEYFRITAAAYMFVARMRSDRTIEETWQECLEINPDDAPGQEEVIELLSQLGSSQLIHSDLAADSKGIFQKYNKRKKKMRKAQMMNFLFLKIPLFNPDRLLNFLRPLGKLLINPLSFIIWISTITWALKTAFENYEEISSQAATFLAPANMPLIFIASMLLKGIHELAHGICCKHFGGKVNSFGVMLLLFVPMPFVDATSSWNFRDKWKRIAVSFAGMYAELFVAALAVIIWAALGPGFYKAIAHNIILIASITTLLFNINPLLKFDGYYILTDLFELPNLQQRSKQFLQYLLEHYAFGLKHSINPTQAGSEYFWLFSYGIAASIYRIILMLSIALLVAEDFFEIGLLLACFTLLTSMVIPTFKFLRYVKEKAVGEAKLRVLSFLGTIAVILIIALGVIPFPEHFKGTGIIKDKGKSTIYAETGGMVEAIHADSGTFLKKGDMILTLVNQELNYEISSSELRLKQAVARYEDARSKLPSSLPSLKKLIEIEISKLSRLKEDKALLEIKSPSDGLWIAPELNEVHGMAIQRGHEIGKVISGKEYEFVSVISQMEASNLYNESVLKSEVRIWGESGENIVCNNFRVIEGEQFELPSAALGWQGGGEIQIDEQDQSGKKAVEPFFLLKADLPKEITYLDERSGVIRLKLEARPLLFQWIHDLRQLLLKRLKI